MHWNETALCYELRRVRKGKSGRPDKGWTCRKDTDYLLSCVEKFNAMLRTHQPWGSRVGAD